MCRDGRQARLAVPHTPPKSVQTDYAGRHPRGRGQAAMFRYMPPDPTLDLCAPQILSLLLQKLAPVRGNMVYGMHPGSAHKEQCTRPSATYV